MGDCHSNIVEDEITYRHQKAIIPERLDPRKNNKSLSTNMLKNSPNLVKKVTTRAQTCLELNVYNNLRL